MDNSLYPKSVDIQLSITFLPPRNAKICCYTFSFFFVFVFSVFLEAGGRGGGGGETLILRNYMKGLKFNPDVSACVVYF